MNRRCSLPHDTVSRRWQVMAAVERQSNVVRHYLVQHLDSRDVRIVSADQLTSLY